MTILLTVKRSRTLMKRLFLTFASVVLLITQVSPIAASTIPFTWDTEYLAFPSYGPTYQDGGIVYETFPVCSSLAEKTLRTSDCIESLQVSSNGQKWVEGSLREYVPTRWTGAGSVAFSKNFLDLVADESKGLFSGGRSSIWRFDGVKHPGGQDFLLSVSAYGVLVDDRVDWRQGFIRGDLFAISKETEGQIEGRDFPAQITAETSSRSCTSGERASYCLTSHTFPKNLRIRLSLRLEKANASLNSSSWIFARMENPNVMENKPQKGFGEIFTIEGSPVDIQSPRILLPNDPSLLSEFCTSWMKSAKGLDEAESSNKKGAQSGAELIQNCLEFHSKGGGLQETSGGNGSTRVFRGWEPFMRYATIRELSSWSFSNPGFSLDVPTAEKLNACPVVEKLGGLVSGNATAVEPGPPKFNPQSAALEYRVAAPHLRADGTRNFGTYSLFVSSQVSRCLWGESLKGASATIEVTSDDGTTQVATSLFEVNEQGLLFTASGFHYSSGTIKVRLNKMASTSAIASKTTMTKILCAKGSLKKRLVGMAPKCPKGFKKVA